MDKYPDLDEAFAAARKAMESAVDEELTSRLCGLSGRLTVQEGQVCFLAVNEDGDQVQCNVAGLVQDVAYGVNAAVIGDEWLVDEARAISKALRAAAEQIDAATSAKGE
jgi:ethanolamine ammonia-lyase large subunit